VSPVQWISSLKRNYVWPAKALQPSSNFRRRKAKVLEIVIARQRQHSQGAAHIKLSPALYLRHQRMFWILSAQNLLCDLGRVPFINLLNGKNSQQVVFDIAQGK